MDNTKLIIWLLALPLLSSPVIYLFGRLRVTSTTQTGKLNWRNLLIPGRWVALAALIATCVPLVLASPVVLQGGFIRAFVGGVPLVLDGISLLLAGTALILGMLVLIFSVPYMSGEEGREKYYALLNLMIGTIIGLGCANDLFNLWVWFEAMAVSSYLLVAFYTHERGALEAGVKYLVQSAVGSTMVLVAIAIVFSQARTLRLDSIVSSYAGVHPGELTLNPIILAAGALFLIGFGVKTALVPAHTWLPDAHSQAPSGISAMLSGVVIEAGLIAMLRALGNIPGGMGVWGGLLMAFGVLNMLVGNLMALRQTQVKRLLAYSSLSHVGYMLVGFGAAALFLTPDAAAGSFFHLFTHAMMKGMAFLAAGVLFYGMHIAYGDHVPLTVDDLNGAARRYPLAAFALSVAVLALGGLPPLAGFMSKWQIFAGAVETRNLAVIGVVVFAALNSVLSLGYYAPLVNRMYRCAPSRLVETGKQASALMNAPLVIMMVIVTVLGFWPGLAQVVTGPAASGLVAMFGSQMMALLH